MPPIKTLSVREVFKEAPQKSALKKSSSEKPAAPKQARVQLKSSAKAPNSSHLTAAQFLQAAKSKTKKKSAPMSEPTPAEEPRSEILKAASNTKKPTQLSLSSSGSSTSSKPARKTVITAPISKLSDSETVVKASTKKATTSKTVKTDTVQPKAPEEAVRAKIKTIPTLAPEAVTEGATTASLESQATTAAKVIKAKRSRVPKDFAQTYGENVKERKVEVIPAKERRARKTAQQRESLRALMTPDDDILRRLARTSVAPIISTLKRRSRKWESRCGKCGVVTAFVTSAALCSRCGAIAVRVLD